jgi:hypothetical protein
MYLLSYFPDTIDVEVSADNKQKVATISYAKTISSKSFYVCCEFKMFGSGFHKYIFDPAEVIAKHAEQASPGETIKRMINYIQFNGEGFGRVEVKGTIAGSSRTVTEVNLYFNSQVSKSPVTIGLYDVKPKDGQYKYENRTNEVIARVNSFAFKKDGGEPFMEINFASIKSSSNEENFISGLAGAIANFFINPPKVSKIGYDTMFRFGMALLNEQSSFTFPKAENIRKTSAAAVNK